MAKVTKSAVAPVAATAPVDGAPVAEKKAFPKIEPNGADTFKRNFDADGKPTPLTRKNAKGEVVPVTTPQVKVIANLLETAGTTGMTRKELTEKLPAAGLVTRQPVGRIISYYQKPMIDDGIIVIEKAPNAAPAAETPAA